LANYFARDARVREVKPVALILVLLAYNVARVLLTYFVGPLREEEDRTGHTPAWKGFDGYGWLWRVHRAASALFIVAIVSGAWTIFNLLRTPVVLPG
jgi:hypothetical protein